MHLALNLFLTVFLFFASTSATAKPIKILVEDSWPPFAFKKENRAVGMSIDIVRAAFKNVGETIELVQVPYTRCKAQTATGRYVACFNSAHSKEMDSDFVFPKEPLFKSKGLILANNITVRKKPNRVKDLEGKSVALPAEFPFGKEFDENTQINKIFTSSDLTSLMMLKSNRVSFVAIDEYVYYYYLKNHPDFKNQFHTVLELSEEAIFVHFSKKHKDTSGLMKKYDIGLAMLKVSPKYNEILEEWVGFKGQKRVQIFSRTPKNHAYDTPSIIPFSID
ncbi:transporter substrate-binding domain-containing protein [Bdellovibrio sp. SKB1291214]|uniref:substrate-binding periplasmic protein n=1 Tax=Bdellovibrio sp. SKB1291214 TaxID=1732569 RepID=UPI000B516357|nr:transporter substrate-binding domain-containing protein [Bdellovibrio sp. SKB1291214]UYL07741.1 transporter substrate-binding domain-containing protein [Bdellovibrio sp. SKB1291214]